MMAIWTARIAGSICLLAIAVIAGLAGWSRTISSSDPDLALKLHPGQASALLSKAEAIRLSADNRSAEMTETAAALLRRAPLLDAPFIYAGQKFAEEGEEARARASFLAAAKRQPRSVMALSWLAADAVRNGRNEDAAGYLDRLWNLNPRDSKLYADVLASIVADHGGLDALDSRLAAGSPLAEAALDRLNTTSNDMGILLRVNTYSVKGRGRLVQRIFSEQGAAPALVAWLSLASEVEAGLISWPLDPVFIGSDAPFPFNWQFLDGAELLKQGGLYISYSGREQKVFAQQVMMLTPGSYLFRADMEVEASAAAGAFQWTIRCHPSQKSLGAVVVRDLLNIDAHDFAFDVPAGEECSAQSLVLHGRPGQFPTRTRATVHKVSILNSGTPE